MRQIGLIILLFFTSLAYAQNVEFKASAPSVVAVGEQFKLEYTLNKEGDNLKVPTLEGFDLLMGPSVGQSFYSSNINGKMTQNVTFSYTYILEGTKKGTFQIPGATVIIDGKEYTSNALKIEVVEGSRNSNGNQAATNRPVQPDANATVNDNNLFVKVEVSRIGSGSGGRADLQCRNYPESIVVSATYRRDYDRAFRVGMYCPSAFS